MKTQQVADRAQSQLTAVIFDDDIWRREGLIINLDRENIKIVGATENMEELRELVRTYSPDIAFLDPRIFPDDRAGLKALEEIKDVAPDTKCIIVSHSVDLQLFYEAFMLEVDAYLHAENASDTKSLGETIRIVMRGTSVYNRSLLMQLRTIMPDKLEPSLPRDGKKRILSGKQFEVAGLLVMGKSNSEIAERLGISEHTVKSHKRDIAIKLDLDSTTEIPRALIDRGILTARPRQDG
jgi:two-component system, NarL family, response regulator LiaR